MVRAPSPKAVPQLVEAFSKSVAGDRLARWATAICPYVMGLSKEQDGMVAQRIGDVAKAAGIPIARGECEPNLMVFFSLTPDALDKNLALRSNYYFGVEPYGVDRVQLANFVREDGAPAHVFYVTGLAKAPGSGAANASGFNGSGITMGSSSEPGRAGGTIDPGGDGAQVLPDYRASRLAPHAEPSLQRVVLVIDGRRLSRVPITQVASYAAMVTLAEVRIAEPVKQVSTITALFSDLDGGRTPAQDLTFWDRAYLGALYGAESQASFSSQRSAMSDRIAHSIEVLNVPTATGSRAPTP